MLICSDFDGTLSQKDPRVLAQNLQAVKEWRAAGNLFAIVTGRNHAVIDQILPGWQNLVDYMVMDNGGAIFSNHDQLIYINELERRLIRQVQSLVCDRAVPLSYSPYRCSIELMLSETAIKLRLWFRTETHFHMYQERIQAQAWPIKILPWIGAGFSKLPSGASTSQFFGFLDIVPADSGKECAIAQLISQKDHHLDRVITVGDDYNDIAMLKAFQGYAISGSPQSVVAAAQGRTVSGVAELMSQNFF